MLAQLTLDEAYENVYVQGFGKGIESDGRLSLGKEDLTRSMDGTTFPVYIRNMGKPVELKELYMLAYEDEPSSSGWKLLRLDKRPPIYVTGTGMVKKEQRTTRSRTARSRRKRRRLMKT